MHFDPQARIPQLLEQATAWVEQQCARILREGQPLDEGMTALAHSVGVVHPDRIRILEVPHLPVPEEEELRQASFAAGMLGARTDGLTLGYGIIVRQGHGSIRLLSHEFRHIYQYEQAGSIAAFLEQYLPQVAAAGYQGSELERDACAHERTRL
jgi:hypothetical protein